MSFSTGCYADAKTESDACCISASAADVIRSFNTDTVIFVPEEYLAGNVANDTGKRIIFPKRLDASIAVAPGSNVIVGWEGRCEVHEKFTDHDVLNVRAQFPDVEVLAHPECAPEVVEVCDVSGSTTAMIRHVHQSSALPYLLLAECCMGDNIAVENPEKEMVRLCNERCPHMNEITLEDTREALPYHRHVIQGPEDIRRRAVKARDRMLAVRPSTGLTATDPWGLQSKEGLPTRVHLPRQCDTRRRRHAHATTPNKANVLGSGTTVMLETIPTPSCGWQW